MQQERYQDLLRETQKKQLVLLAKQSCEPSQPFHHRAFTRLGKQMMTWGAGLGGPVGYNARNIGTGSPAVLNPGQAIRKAGWKTPSSACFLIE